MPTTIARFSVDLFAVGWLILHYTVKQIKVLIATFKRFYNLDNLCFIPETYLLPRRLLVGKI